ncbi:MAG TPA: hypothetical protein VJC39_00535 [Candidatus Nanoarchaeia archaeon]|nr:hypothetical protein [Candidatus Nanoarchaeia archaeon]
MVYTTDIEAMDIVTPSLITKIKPLLELGLAIRPDEPYLQRISIETMIAYAGNCSGLTVPWKKRGRKMK